MQSKHQLLKRKRHATVAPMVARSVAKPAKTNALVSSWFGTVCGTVPATGQLKHVFYSSLFLSCRRHGSCFFVGVVSSHRLTWFSVTVCG
jgi:hypothetical protein